MTASAQQVPSTRYAVVGLGGRCHMYLRALLEDYRDRHALVAFCDVNPGRMAHYNEKFKAQLPNGPLPTYAPADFEKMIREQRVQTVIVTTIDRTHHEYIVRAMEAGCDVLTEKPLTTDDDKCRVIHDAIKRTGRKLRVTFNYRYAPVNSLVKEVLAKGAIGEVISVHFEWTLDTNHGADYFRRWHRDVRNSGGLMVHKSSHHFDLVNWWLGSQPETVFGMGDLRFYGKANGEARGDYKPYARATGNPAAKGDPFAMELTGGNKALYLDHEVHDGYVRDQNVFGDGISIQDDMSVLVRYRNRATMTYHLTAYSPWEGYRVMFNGTKGRVELVFEENAYVGNAGDPRMEQFGAAMPMQAEAQRHILVRPLWSKPYRIELPKDEGGHGGGDKRLLDDIFIGGVADPLGRAADHIDGTYAILTGVAANKSFATGNAVSIADLLPR